MTYLKAHLCAVHGRGHSWCDGGCRCDGKLVPSDALVIEADAMPDPVVAARRIWDAIDPPPFHPWDCAIPPYGSAFRQRWDTLVATAGFLAQAMDKLAAEKVTS